VCVQNIGEEKAAFAAVVLRFSPNHEYISWHNVSFSINSGPDRSTALAEQQIRGDKFLSRSRFFVENVIYMLSAGQALVILLF
jgi:hypothetical protein